VIFEVRSNFFYEKAAVGDQKICASGENSQAKQHEVEKFENIKFRILRVLRVLRGEIEFSYRLDYLE
jgi:hypothetical protein